MTNSAMKLSDLHEDDAQNIRSAVMFMGHRRFHGEAIEQLAPRVFRVNARNTITDAITAVEVDLTTFTALEV